jgi:hypothetical protein
VDNIGKLDVQKDGDSELPTHHHHHGAAADLLGCRVVAEGGDDSDNDDDNVDNIHPKWFAPGVEKDKKAANIAASKTISILRAACPDQMEALAKLVKDNEQCVTRDWPSLLQHASDLRSQHTPATCHIV